MSTTTSTTTVTSLPTVNPGKHTIFLFDVDGTLTASRKVITPEMQKFMNDIKKKVTCGIVGGSDIAKQQHQLGSNVIQEWPYIFAENGLDAYKNGKELARQNLSKALGDDNLKELVNAILKYLSDLDIPIKRGTFIEYRSGMLNVSPIGRNCSQQERNEFEIYDGKHKIRKTMIESLSDLWQKHNLKTSIGGQISFDVFPHGWDKTFCLPFLEKDGFTEIHFFGDKTWEGGNDYEIFQSSKTIGHTVKSPADTREIITNLLGDS